MTRCAAPIFRIAAWFAAALVEALAIPVVQGYHDGPRFPVLDPFTWEGYKQIGRNMAFRL